MRVGDKHFLAFQSFAEKKNIALHVQPLPTISEPVIFWRFSLPTIQSAEKVTGLHGFVYFRDLFGHVEYVLYC